MKYIGENALDPDTVTAVEAFPAGEGGRGVGAHKNRCDRSRGQVASSIATKRHCQPAWPRTLVARVTVDAVAGDDVTAELAVDVDEGARPLAAFAAQSRTTARTFLRRARQHDQLRDRPVTGERVAGSSKLLELDDDRVPRQGLPYRLDEAVRKRGHRPILPVHLADDEALNVRALQVYDSGAVLVRRGR